jgi:hypothetical protein
MDVRLWNLLHDGHINRIEGSLPGDLRLEVSVLYLRQMLPGEGEGFFVLLSKCSRFEYVPWDEQPIEDLRAIEALSPELLSAEPGDPIEVCCSGGMLRLRYEAARVELDSGEPIDIDSLENAAVRYWRKFEARTQLPQP